MACESVGKPVISQAKLRLALKNGDPRCTGSTPVCNINGMVDVLDAQGDFLGIVMGKKKKKRNTPSKRALWKDKGEGFVPLCMALVGVHLKHSIRRNLDKRSRKQ